MESKRCIRPDGVAITLLLIEPVWNRNMEIAGIMAKETQLLIEPVWNRNFEFMPRNLT